jgi:hypothetical protein
MTRTPPPPPPVHPLAATTRYCAGLAKFGLTPTQCLAGAGARYDAALHRLIARAVPHG